MFLGRRTKVLEDGGGVLDRRGLLQMVIGGATAAGAAAGGFVADSFGLRAPFYVGAVLLLATSLISARGEKAAD